MTATRGLRFGLLVALVALVGCSPGSSDDPAPVFFPPQEPMHPLVAEILDDGEVTFAEMERAVFAYAGCLEEAGFPVTYVDLDPFWYELEIGFESGPDEATAARADAANEECSRRFFDPVFDVWADDTVREIVEERERLIRLACFAEQGLVLPGDTPWDDIWETPPELDWVTRFDCERAARQAARDGVHD